jgi:hypothetical protein
MSKQSESLRQQARTAKRIAETVADVDVSETLRTLAEMFEEDAARLERERRLH